MADHSDKWGRCVHDVGNKGSAINPYAVCTSSVKEACAKTFLPFQLVYTTPKKTEKQAMVATGASQLTRAKGKQNAWK